MEFFSILGIAIALAMDAFSVSVSIGAFIDRLFLSHYIRVSSLFGFFQFIMPILGYYAGIFLSSFFLKWTYFIVFILLSFIGLKMIFDSLFLKEENRKNSSDPTRGLKLLILSVATSIDALSVGVGFGLLHQPILFPSIIIGLVCALFSIIGIFLGKKIGNVFGKKAEIFGGVILIFIAIKMFFFR